MSRTLFLYIFKDLVRVFAMASGGAVVPSPPRIPGFDTPAPRATGPGPATPGYASAPTYPRAAPPPKKSSGCLIIGLVVGLVFLVVIAILAAIAIPAYSDYQHRARVANAVGIVSQLKNQVTEFAMNTDRCRSTATMASRARPRTPATTWVRCASAASAKTSAASKWSSPCRASAHSMAKCCGSNTTCRARSGPASSDLDTEYLPAQCRG